MARSTKLTEHEMEAKVREFEDWIRSQPNMPQNLGKSLLARYLSVYSYRLDKAKVLLTKGLEFRKKHPWFFTNRDPESREIKTVVSLVDMIPLFQSTKENYKVCFYQLLSDDSTDVVFNDCIKTFFMACDVRFNLPVDSYSELESGETIIFDMKNLTFKHLTTIVISTLRLFFKYLQDAHPVRIVQLHVINCTPVLNRAMMLIKPFMYEKLYNALKFHNVGSMDSLYEYVPREILPLDYGGDAQSMAELKKYWVKRCLEDNRDFLLDDQYYSMKDEDCAETGKNKYRGIFSFLSS